MTLVIIVWHLLGFSVWYIPARLKALKVVSKPLWWRIVASVFLVGYMLLVFSDMYTRDNFSIGILYNILGLAFVFWVYLFFYLVITHPLIRIRSLPKKGIGYAGIILSVALVTWGFINAQNFKVTHYDLQTKGLEKDVKIVHLPDIHLGTQRGAGYLNKILKVIEEEQPDIVLYNGDLVDSDIALKSELFSLFKQVKAEQYYTTGNHEYYMNTDKALQLIDDAGIKILRNEMIETHGVQLIGLEYMNADRETYDAHAVNELTIEDELPKIKRDREKPTVVVHHSPVGMQYVANGGAQLMLSGHTHAGQFFPGTAMVPLRFPMYKGLHEIGNTKLLVSQGAGTFGPMMRLGSSNEVQVINLIPKI
jgi:predicted MPP superfamily phosphohydrolase